MQIDGETMETAKDCILGGSKITADGDCSYEIKRCFLLGRKTMMKLDSISKSRDTNLLTKVHLVTAFLPRSKHLLISWLQSPSAVILDPEKIKSDTVSPSICNEVMGPDAMISVLLSFKSQLFHSPLSLSSRGSLVSSLSAIRVVSSAYLRLSIFSQQS